MYNVRFTIAPQFGREVELSQTLRRQRIATAGLGASCWLASSSVEPGGGSLFAILGSGPALGGQIAVRIALRTLQEAFEELSGDSAASPEELLKELLERVNRSLLSYRSGMAGSEGVAARGVVCVLKAPSLAASIWGDFACFINRGGMVYPLAGDELPDTAERGLGERALKLGEVSHVALEGGDLVVLSSFSASPAVTEHVEQQLCDEGDLREKGWQLYRRCLEESSVLNMLHAEPYLMLFEADCPVIMLEEVI